MDSRIKTCPREGCKGLARRNFTSLTFTCCECKTDFMFSIPPLKTVLAKYSYSYLNTQTPLNQCPKCHVQVERTKESERMVCYLCKYEWCWTCHASYDPLHLMPFNTLGCTGISAALSIKVYLCWMVLMVLARIFAPTIVGAVKGLMRYSRFLRSF